MSDIVLELDKYIAECWENILAEVGGTAVYIDRHSIECLHWYTAGKGYLALKDAGAVAVQELDMYHFPYIEVKGTKKAIVVSASDEPAFYQRTIKMFLAKNAFESCKIYCGAPCSTTNNLKNTSADERLNYFRLRGDVKTWMSVETIAQQPTVDVIHVPIFIARLNQQLFVTPPFGDLMPSLDTTVSKDTLSKLNLLACLFHELSDKLNVKLDIYSVGRASDRLAEYLENHTASSDRRNHFAGPGVAERRVSLVLMDRTLDLCTPTSNSTDSFLTKLLQTLPRLPHHRNDVAIGMSSFLGTVEGVLQAWQVSGCLASVEKTVMDLLISTKGGKQSLASAVNSGSTRKDTRLGDEDLSVRSDELRSIAAIVEAPRSPRTGQLELLTSLEKLALQNLSASREFSSILAQLSNVVRTRIHRGLDTENLLALAIHIYALAGTQIRMSMQQERQLEQSIADAIFEDFEIFTENPSLGSTSAYQRALLQLGTNDARETSYKIATRIVGTLRSVAEQRSALLDYRFCMIKPDTEDAIRRVGVLEQMATDIICASIDKELRDFHQRPSSLISAGFNLLLRGKMKHHPRDNSLIIIYIVGGISADEAKVIERIGSISNDKGTPYVMLGGSRLLNPLDMVDNILFS